MKTETISLYKFEELSDKAKEKARDWWRSFPNDFAWSEESLNSIETFCKHFGVRLLSWEIGAHCPYFFKTDADNSNFRGLKLKDFNRDHMPTGYCLDCDLWETFYDVFKKTGDAKHAFNIALDSGFKAWRDDMEGQLSDEYIDDMLNINEYDFLQSGERAPRFA